MDPATLVMQALATGAGAGLGNAASASVFDAYRALRQACVQRLPGRLGPSGHEEDPADVTEACSPFQAQELVRALAAAGALDAHLVDLARRLLDLADAAGTRSGAHRVDARGARGVQVGDHNTQHNTFS
ncbi:hypothetical protein AB0F07_24095 [Streptomyces fructofermentans]|uniref:hypothetical protein n=1 Tax=Streptomyces fructofermentans TaxID=152141 RepID=UPI0033D474BF